MTHRLRNWGVFLSMSIGLLAPLAAMAHCDTLDGPVVTDARTALEKETVTPVLKWVRAEDAEAIEQAFVQTLKVRALGAEAKALAEQFFFETLVRLHRAGEGAPYTGLQAAGTVDPIIAEADKAIISGEAKPLLTMLVTHAEHGLHVRFTKVVETRKHANESVEAGRAYVAAYVDYVHYIENLHKAIAGTAPHGAATTEHEAHE